MTRWICLACAAAALGFSAAAVSAPHDSHRARRCHRRHRHRRCSRPTPSGPLPGRLEVDENDQGQPPQPYSLWPSHNPVAAGRVQFNVYDFGQDPHTFAVVNSGGHQLAFARVPANQPETAVPVSVSLPPGTYTLECTLPGHARLGMVATLTVR
jgi:plastocyanin